MAESTLHKVLFQIAEKNNFTNPKIAINDSPNHGYLTNVHKITLKDGSTNEELHLFAKEKPKNIKPEWNFLYSNEAIFYNTIVGAFRDVLTKNEPTLPKLPKCYFADEDFIILEDLMESRYKVWNPLNVILDSEHIKAVLEAYGKFHAFSFVFKHKHPEKFNSTGYKFEWGIKYHQVYKDCGYYDSISKKLSACFDSNTETHYINAIKKYYSGKQVEYLQKLIDSNVTDVFVHGDNWTHNYMFQYDKNDKPNSVCILDFQLCRKTSPVVDLSYFLGVCACSEEIFGSMWDYLKVYHQSLEKHLTLLDCPMVYSWETLKEEWLKFSLKGFGMAAMVYTMMIADKDEIDQREHLEIPQKFVFISRNEQLYKERMRIVIKYFYHAGCFDF